MLDKFVFLILASCSAAATAGASSNTAKTLTLAAAATDAGAAVFTDGAELHKVAVGEWLPGKAWQVESIRRGAVTLKSARKLSDRDLRLQVRVGGQVSADALAPIDAMQRPMPYPKVVTHADDPPAPATDR